MLKLMIGEIVNYVHQNPVYEIKNDKKILNGYEIIQGEGIIRSIHVDHTKRLICQVADEKNVFNIDYNCINANQEFIDKYSVMCGSIDQLADEARKKQAKIVEEYNAMISKLRDDVLGKQLEIDYVKKETTH